MKDKDRSSVSSIFLDLAYLENSTDLIMHTRLGGFIIFPSMSVKAPVVSAVHPFVSASVCQSV